MSLLTTYQARCILILVKVSICFMEEIIKKLKDHDAKLDIIARTVAEHTDRLDSIDGKLDGMVTKIDDISRIMNVLDEYVGMTKKKDQELTAVT